MTDWIVAPPFVSGRFAKATQFQSMLNTDMSMAMHRLAYKTSDQIVNNSSTLVDITEMSVTVPPNEMWYMEWEFRYSSPTSGDTPAYKVNIATSGTMRGYLRSIYWTTATTPLFEIVDFRGDLTAYTTGLPVYIIQSGTYSPPLIFKGLVFTGTSGCTMKGQFAQYAVTAEDTKTRQGSCVNGMKIGANPYPDLTVLT